MFDTDEMVTGAHADHQNNGPDHQNNDHGHKNNDPDHKNSDHHHFDRCSELVFDAAIENKEGVHYFFKGE